MIFLTILAIVIDPALAAKISALALIVGTLGSTAQALLQKPWWSPKVKWALSWVWAIVGGAASYITINGLPTDLMDLATVFAFVVGAYGSIRLAYEALKRPVLDKIEKDAGVGAGETPPGQQDPADLDDEDGHLSTVLDPYEGR